MCVHLMCVCWTAAYTSRYDFFGASGGVSYSTDDIIYTYKTVNQEVIIFSLRAPSRVTDTPADAPANFFSIFSPKDVPTAAHTMHEID